MNVSQRKYDEARKSHAYSCPCFNIILHGSCFDKYVHSKALIPQVYPSTSGVIIGIDTQRR